MRLKFIGSEADGSNGSRPINQVRQPACRAILRMKARRKLL